MAKVGDRLNFKGHAVEVEEIMSRTRTFKAECPPAHYDEYYISRGSEIYLSREVDSFKLGDVIELSDESVRFRKLNGEGTFLLHTKFKVRKA